MDFLFIRQSALYHVYLLREEKNYIIIKYSKMKTNSNYTPEKSEIFGGGKSFIQIAGSSSGTGILSHFEHG